MRTPVDVQHRARVTTYCRVDLVYTSSLRDKKTTFVTKSVSSAITDICQRDMKMSEGLI